MFSDNKKISSHQMARLLIFDLFTCAALYLPGALAKAALHEILLSALAGLLVAWAAGEVFVWSADRCQGSFLAAARKRCGSGAPAVWAFFGFRCLFTLVFMLYVFVKVLKQTFLYSASSLALAASMALVLVYACLRGTQVRARLAEILFYLILVPILCISLFSLPEADFSQIVRLDGFSGAGWLRGVLVVTALFMPVEWFLFTEEARSRSKNRQVMTAAVLTGGGLALVIVLLCVCVLTPEKMAKEPWPGVLLMQIVRIPGGFLSRQDGLMLSFWIFGMFMSLSGALSHSARLFRMTVGKGSHKAWLSLTAALACAAALTAQKGEGFDQIYFTAMLLTFPVSLGIALYVADVRGKRRILTGFLAAVMGAGVLMSVGCARYVALEDRAFVMAVGIDKEDGGYRISFAFPDLAKLTGNGKGGYEEPVSFSGKSLAEAELAYEKTGKGSVDYGQVKVIVLGEDLLDDEKALADILGEMTDDPKFARTILLCGVRGKAEDLIRLDGDMDGSIGIYLEELFENNGEKLGYETVILNDAAGMDPSGNGPTLTLPMLEIEGKRPVLKDRISIFVLAHPGMSLYTVG